MEHVIRAVRADEWAKVKDIRLASLRDPVAHLAFLETYDTAAARPDSLWQERAARAAEGVAVRQFVAEAPDGRWDGTVTVLVERPGEDSVFGEPTTMDQTQVVAVFVRPEARGAGLADALFRAALEWSWELAGPPIQRVRLHVHEENARADAFYRKFGFVATGRRVDEPGQPGVQDLEYEVRRPGPDRA
ncbi:GNAT family N-acetyltransferase [Streptomyces sp. NPDC003860]